MMLAPTLRSATSLILLSAWATARAAAQSIVEIAADTPEFSTLVTAVTQAGLEGTLSDDGPFTVFAPNNDAFADLDPEVLSRLLEEPWAAHLEAILLYHVVDGEVFSGDLEEGLVSSLLEDSGSLNVTLEPIQVNGANVIDPLDVEADNGVIHTIDQVLLPSFMVNDIVATAQGQETLSTLVDLLVAADLVGTLQGSDFTVLAPSNEAFDALGEDTLATLTDPANVATLTNILLYHVVPGVVTSSALLEGSIVTASGENITVTSLDPVAFNDVEVITPDILASNGVIHVVEEVLLPPSDAPTPAPETDANNTIVDIAASNPDFETLATALLVAGLDEALSGEGPFTVFAPNEDAFELVDSGTLTRLLEPQWKPHLEAILLYHVVDGAVLAEDLEQGPVPTLLEGNDLNATLDPIQVNGVDVIDPFDVEASNGVIHAVAEVLLPSFMSSDIVATAQANPDLSTLVALVIEADLVETLQSEDGFTVFAPVNDAFVSLTAGDDAANLTTSEVSNILLYHVVPGIVTSSMLMEGPVTTANGENITILSLDPVTINDGAEVIDADILTSNGVVHVINQVLLPPATPSPSVATSSPTMMAVATTPTSAPTGAPTPSESSMMDVVENVTTSMPVVDNETTSMPTMSVMPATNSPVAEAEDSGTPAPTMASGAVFDSARLFGTFLAVVAALYISL